MKVLVAGGAGFIGSHLCEKLLSEGNQVICVDNLLTGDLQNIDALTKNPNFIYINADITEPLADNLGRIEEIYHFASPASPSLRSKRSYHAFPFGTMSVNTQGTWNLCEFAAIHGAKLLFASTSEVYGEPLEHPQKETYRGNVSTTGPRAIYDEAKRFGETIVSTFVREKNLDGRIIRIFNTYGPRMALDDGRVVIEFAVAALNGDAFPIEGDGKATRSFMYVDDLVEGVIKAMRTGDTRGQIYNLGNPEEFSISDLAQKMNQIVGSHSGTEFLPNPEDAPTKRCPDITKAKEKLNWEPKVSLDEGLKKLVEYLKTAPQVPVK